MTKRPIPSRPLNQKLSSFLPENMPPSQVHANALTSPDCSNLTEISMRVFGRLLIAVLALVLPIFAETAMAQTTQPLDPENTLVLTLKDGPVVIRLRPDLAPNHVARIKELARQGFYDGTPFHRVIDGFMAQGGDPTGTGMGGSGQHLKAEFSNARHVRGTASMARASDPNSADSQFFICFEPAPFLDGQYTIWGEVVSGMEHVDAIKRGAGSSGTVSNPDKIISMKVMADTQAPAATGTGQ